jgi:hypothetical protein
VVAPIVLLDGRFALRAWSGFLLDIPLGLLNQPRVSGGSKLRDMLCGPVAANLPLRTGHLLLALLRLAPGSLAGDSLVPLQVALPTELGRWTNQEHLE